MADNDKDANVTGTPAITPARPDPVLSQHTPTQWVTIVLLNGRNFAAWSRSFRLYLGGKGKSGWILGTEKKPAISDPTFAQWDMDNCTILGRYSTLWKIGFIICSCFMLLFPAYGPL